ncbi:MAG: ATP phosphoribosyltransferase regulatory subunit [Gammaproteobacteria bacterium]|nr:MAG: ATP phosphoribosyltransferase regulatory subunit [Gammaproteobacteria bacterium]
MKNNAWLLPEGIDELLPVEAEVLENYRRRILDHFNQHGYDLVMPPFIEYLESLLSGTGNDLDLKTFKIIDQVSGRLMGIRADMTPQISRIDSHRLASDSISRLCYMGTVLHTRPDSFASSRSPLQFGAELFGHKGSDSDVEIMSLMFSVFEMLGIENVYFDIGHVAIFRNLSAAAGLKLHQEKVLFDALQRKAVPEIEFILNGFENVDGKYKKIFSELALLNGGAEVLDKAEAILESANQAVKEALSDLKQIAETFTRRHPQVKLHFDLAELRGYNYQTGVVFAAFVPSLGQEIARGGRYDEIGKIFGKARPATGFSSDLKMLVSLIKREEVKRELICAPAENDTELDKMIAELRASGSRVIKILAGEEGIPGSDKYTHELVRQDGVWKVVSTN